MDEQANNDPCRLAMWRPPQVGYDVGGMIGRRLAANLEQWLLVAPQANPAMLEMFRDRDRHPRRDLVPWAGEFAGKYLTSAVLCHRVLPDDRLHRALASFVEKLIRTQDPDGYLGPFPMGDRLTGRTRDGERPLWDLWGHYHCILGLLLWHDETGHREALEACCRAADHICTRFLGSEERVRDAEAEEMNMAIAHAMALLYQRTGEPRYLELVRDVEREWTSPGAGDYVRQALAGIPFYQTPKPRWESLHDIQAISVLYEVTGEEAYREAFEQIWRSIALTDRHNTGGFSSGEKATGNPYDPAAIETCCVVAWMALSVDMLKMTGDPRVADELELSTFNAALGAQSPSGRWWTYNTPMDGVRKASAHDIVFQAREGAPELNCCSVNGPRTLGMLSEWALVQDPVGYVLNYYGPSTFSLYLPNGAPLILTQRTDYPCGGAVQIEIDLDTPACFTLKFRVPGWSTVSTATLNARNLGTITPGSYLELEREWRRGDTISLKFDMSLRVWLGEKEARGKVSLYCGPVLLAFDRRHNAVDLDDMSPVDIEDLAATARVWEGEQPAPWMLYQVRAADGSSLVLCDFASAGSAGTPYRTWIPRSH